MREKLSLPEARRVVLAAQGFSGARAAGPIGRPHFNKVLARLGLFQIDSVSAVVRAHYMPLFSRLGPYPMALLDDAASPKKRRLFEYWAHEASFLPLEIWPLMQWRMERARANDESEIYKGLARWAAQNGKLIEAIHGEVAERGPIAASDIDGAKGKGGWWGWSDEKHAFEWLFWAGRITTHSRRGFERLYDLPERVIPKDIFDAPVPKPEDAHRELLRISARALGVATYGDLRDYFRLSPSDVKGRLEELVEGGELLSVKVDGWKQPAYL
nr:winged helix DNA-binding domain-containing protein [Pseudomonadota bacterium]